MLCITFGVTLVLINYTGLQNKTFFLLFLFFHLHIYNMSALNSNLFLVLLYRARFSYKIKSNVIVYLIFSMKYYKYIKDI